MNNYLSSQNVDVRRCHVHESDVGQVEEGNELHWTGQSAIVQGNNVLKMSLFLALSAIQSPTGETIT
jgi:hypothetical protein